MEHPQQARKRLHQKMGILHIILAPFFAIIYCISLIMRVLGLESKWVKAIFDMSIQDGKARMRKGFQGYTPTKNDVFVCSYPKSGTNWGMQIAYQIANRGLGEYEHVHDVIAWPDATKDGIAVPLNHPMSQQTSTGLRVIKTHAVATDVPYNQDGKYVCIVRDPKDATVSAYHFFRDVELGYLLPTVPAWLDLVLSDNAVSWPVFTSTYWAWRGRPNVLFLTFEEMKIDLEGTVKKIADLMGVALTEAEFERVCYLSSYKYMKTIDHKFYPGRISPLASPDGSMIRSGKKDAAGELLSKSQQDRIDAYCAQALKEMGCDFPYSDSYMKNVQY